MIAWATILANVLLVVTAASSAPDRPVTFARSGRPVRVAVTTNGAKPVRSVVLHAFGRTWTVPMAVKDNVAKLTAPSVRVPVVFKIVAKDSGRVVGELVTYPDQPAKRPEVPGLYAVGAPVWFQQWASAIGVPMTQVGLDDMRSGRWRRTKAKGDLLVVGAAAAGQSASEVIGLADGQDINMLVLEATWLGQTRGPNSRIAVRPDQMKGALADLRKHQWSILPSFSRHASPADIIANRWAWIEAEDSPLVEEIGSPEHSRLPTLSYLPWQQSLGRCDVADTTLIEILTCSARKPRSDGPRTPVTIIHPIRKEWSATKRAVLARLKVAESVSPEAVRILDLRGDRPLPKDMLSRLKRVEEHLEPSAGALRQARLLVLGDDQVLDRWRFVKCDRRKGTLRREGVVWLSDDELPASSKMRIRLMQALSDLNVPIWDSIQEMSHETLENKP